MKYFAPAFGTGETSNGNCRDSVFGVRSNHRRGASETGRLHQRQLPQVRSSLHGGRRGRRRRLGQSIYANAALTSTSPRLPSGPLCRRPATAQARPESTRVEPTANLGATRPTVAEGIDLEDVIANKLGGSQNRQDRGNHLPDFYWQNTMSVRGGS